MRRGRRRAVSAQRAGMEALVSPVPSETNLGGLDPKIRWAHMQSDTPTNAYLDAGGSRVDEYGYPAIGHVRLHDPREPEIVHRLTTSSMPDPYLGLSRELPAPVSYTERDLTNRLIVPEGRASVRARQPKAFVGADQFADDGAANMGPTDFSIGKIALRTPYTRVAPYQYLGQWWEAPQQIQRVQPDLYGDQTPPAFLRTEGGEISQVLE